MSVADKFDRNIRETPSLLGYEIFAWLNAIEGAPALLSAEQIEAITKHIATFDHELSEQFQRFMRKSQA